ncbi:MAG: tRNA preQ1(34) S-adenosylmethionine ribosyltransferase-isomerase QueA [Gemmataceae bacterium]|nr:tRNA preQ1(34) S-adenosylmethionine ribosyltransferase-isomerase QueA [Gemmataceae bacterium]
MNAFPFDYTLLPDLIAQEPCEPRDHARLLVARRSDGSLHHHRFHELPQLLQLGDLLVLNDTRVLPARLLGTRSRTGGKWEGLFLRELPDATWEMLCQTRGSLQEGETIDIEPGPLRLELLARLPGGRWQAKPLAPGTTIELLDRFGHIPLPPYIRKGAANEADRERYQAIYAQQAGAVAAPTAGLHFTERVFAALKERGIGWTTVTLHVGLATFQTIQVDDYTQHPMHMEWGQLTQQAADVINACEGRVVAVGTTSMRVLESVARQGPLQAWSGETNLYVHPPYDFKIADALVTNFHLPRTTLLLLVAAFAGVELLQKAYGAALAERYRFYSYGDAMLIV